MKHNSRSLIALAALAISLPSISYAQNTLPNFIPTQNTLTSDQTLACEMTLCLSASKGRPQECDPIIKKYLEIKARTFSATQDARANFLKKCPMQNGDSDNSGQSGSSNNTSSSTQPAIATPAPTAADMVAGNKVDPSQLPPGTHQVSAQRLITCEQAAADSANYPAVTPPAAPALSVPNGYQILTAGVVKGVASNGYNEAPIYDPTTNALLGYGYALEVQMNLVDNSGKTLLVGTWSTVATGNCTIANPAAYTAPQ